MGTNCIHNACLDSTREGVFCISLFSYCLLLFSYWLCSPIVLFLISYCSPFVLLLFSYCFLIVFLLCVTGPGQYCDTGMGADSIRKAYLDSTRRGVFGTTSVRIQPMTKRTEVELPGPAHYQVPEKVHTPKYQQLSANFASLSTRLHEAPTVIKVGDLIHSL